MSEKEVFNYLGKRGFSIIKDKISNEKLEFIRDKLTVKPYVPKAPVQPESFQIYRESKKKIYIPRFFGIEHFGYPNEDKISKGDDISLNFNGNLRDYQKKIVDIYLNHCKNKWSVVQI